MDFTSEVFRILLKALQDNGFDFCTVKDAFAKRQDETSRYVILRHDVDKKPGNSLVTAKIESDFGIKGTYYFRTLPGSFDEKIIRGIKSMGHEIGYHYEDLDLAWRKAKGERRKEKGKGARDIADKDLVSSAYESFRNSLAKLREIVHVDTICMHGSPMSPVDNRLLWRYYDYRELGIIAEPYFDFSFDRMLYLTDTGRCWNGKMFSLRDKAVTSNKKIGANCDWKVQPVAGSLMNMTASSVNFQSGYVFMTTRDIIASASKGELPDKIMMTFHPQRWNDRLFSWIGEFMWQKFKNGIKYYLVK